MRQARQGCQAQGAQLSCMPRLSQVALSAHAAYWTPEPLGPGAPPERFAEGRALRTVRRLTSEVGLRRVRFRSQGSPSSRPCFPA